MKRTDEDIEQLNTKMAMMHAAAQASLHASGVLQPLPTHFHPAAMSPPRHR
jgi:hypothetical protein